MSLKYANVYDPAAQRNGRAFNSKRCAFGVTDKWGKHQCSRRPAVQEHDHGWCNQHAPSLLARLDKISTKKDKAQARLEILRAAAKDRIVDMAIRWHDGNARKEDLDSAIDTYLALLEERVNVQSS